MSIESVMPSSHLILCRPLLLLPPITPSIRGFSSKSTLHLRCPKYWSFSTYIIWHHSFQRNPRADLLQNGLVGYPCSPRDPQESSPFFDWVVYFLEFSCINCLSIFYISCLSVASSAIIFSHSEGCLFTLLIAKIWKQPRCPSADEWIRKL